MHPSINVIFAINDTTAAGAMAACRELGLAPAATLLVTFGLEGDTMKDALFAQDYCKAGLAMFPEIVGRVCVEAAIQSVGRRPLPAQLVTPHAVLTAESLSQFYKREESDLAVELAGGERTPDGPATYRPDVGRTRHCAALHRVCRPL